MSTLAIEINDAGLVVANRDEVLATEPGYALVDSGEISTGLEAFGRARTQPRLIDNRFWSELSLDPNSVGLAGVRNSAELAYVQLESLWRRCGADADRVVLVVPSHMSQDQLGLLLGLAQECEMPVAAMVDAAVAASVRPYPGRQLVFADAGLHRVSVTPLEQAEEATALPAAVLGSIGLVTLNDLLAKRLAEIFVLATRFDPFHDAASEQHLYDRLSGWLETLQAEDEAELTLPYRGEDFTVEVKREQLLSVASGFYRALVQLIAQVRKDRSGLVVQLSDRLYRLPGLEAELARLDDAIVVGLPQGHAARAALLGLEQLDVAGGGVKLIRHLGWRAPADESLPVAQPAPEEPRQAARSSGPRPTHIVYRGFAYLVDGHGLVIGRSEAEGGRSIVIGDQSGVSRAHCELSVRDGELVLRDTSSYGTFVNERRVSGETALKQADVIRVGSPGAELHVVIVEAAHGA